MSLPFDTVSCARLGSDDGCSGCGWKCDCYECTGPSSSGRWRECQCPCRFWVVVCFVVLVGFSVVFYIATVFRRTLLYSMASAAVAIAAGLSALAAGTDQCGWPAFFSISMVFVFPCFYSCCWQFQAHRRRGRERDGNSASRSTRDHGRWPLRGRARGTDPLDKHGATVVIVFPDGDVMLGVEEEDGGNDGFESKKKKDKGEKSSTRNDRDLLEPSGSSGDVQDNEDTAGAVVPANGSPQIASENDAQAGNGT